MMNFIAPGIGPVLFNIRGEQVKKTPFTHPYGYDPFCIWRKDWQDTDHVVYSDRLIEWDTQKYFDSLEAAGIKAISQATPEQIEKFLRIYFDKDTLTLTGIEEWCHHANGNTYYMYYYRN